MVLTTIPRWEQELMEELREVIEDQAREEEINFRFVEDSKAIGEGISQIRNTMSRLKNEVKSYEEKKVLRENQEDLKKYREERCDMEDFFEEESK